MGPTNDHNAFAVLFREEETLRRHHRLTAPPLSPRATSRRHSPSIDSLSSRYGERRGTEGLARAGSGRSGARGAAATVVAVLQLVLVLVLVLVQR